MLRSLRVLTEIPPEGPDHGVALMEQWLCFQQGEFHIAQAPPLRQMGRSPIVLHPLPLQLLRFRAYPPTILATVNRTVRSGGVLYVGRKPTYRLTGPDGGRHDDANDETGLKDFAKHNNDNGEHATSPVYLTTR